MVLEARPGAGRDHREPGEARDREGGQRPSHRGRFVPAPQHRSDREEDHEQRQGQAQDPLRRRDLDRLVVRLRRDPVPFDLPVLGRAVSRKRRKVSVRSHAQDRMLGGHGDAGAPEMDPGLRGRRAHVRDLAETKQKLRAERREERDQEGGRHDGRREEPGSSVVIGKDSERQKSRRRGDPRASRQGGREHWNRNDSEDHGGDTRPVRLRRGREPGRKGKHHRDEGPEVVRMSQRAWDTAHGAEGGAAGPREGIQPRDLEEGVHEGDEERERSRLDETFEVTWIGCKRA